MVGSCIDSISLKILDGLGEFLHVVIIFVGYLIEPGYVMLSGYGYKLTTQLLMYRDGVVIMIVADLGFCLVQSPSYYIFRHVHACCICIFCLYGVLPISPNVTSRVSEQQLLKAPQPVTTTICN